MTTTHAAQMEELNIQLYIIEQTKIQLIYNTFKLLILGKDYEEYEEEDEEKEDNWENFKHNNGYIDLYINDDNEFPVAIERRDKINKISNDVKIIFLKKQNKICSDIVLYEIIPFLKIKK